MKIGILECWTNRPEWLEKHGDFADWFAPFLHKADPLLTFDIFHAHQDHLPEAPDSCDAWLVTGSAASVCENLPWQKGLANFLEVARAVRPIIGVCYGHQLLHAMLGGKVEKAESWGVGIHCYDVSGDIGGLRKMRLVASHQDQVTRAAPGSRILASSLFCPIAATQIDDHIITIQPHPEITVDNARDVITSRREKQGSEITDIALASLDTPLDDKEVAFWMVNFLKAFDARKSQSQNRAPHVTRPASVMTI